MLVHQFLLAYIGFMLSQNLAALAQLNSCCSSLVPRVELQTCLHLVRACHLFTNTCCYFSFYKAAPENVSDANAGRSITAAFGNTDDLVLQEAVNATSPEL